MKKKAAKSVVQFKASGLTCAICGKPISRCGGGAYRHAKHPSDGHKPTVLEWFPESKNPGLETKHTGHYAVEIAKKNSGEKRNLQQTPVEILSEVRVTETTDERIERVSNIIELQVINDAITAIENFVNLTDENDQNQIPAAKIVGQYLIEELQRFCDK